MDGKGQAANLGGITDTEDFLSPLRQYLEGTRTLTFYCRVVQVEEAVEGEGGEERYIYKVTEKSEDRENYSKVGSSYILIPTLGHMIFICIYLALCFPDMLIT